MAEQTPVPSARERFVAMLDGEYWVSSDDLADVVIAERTLVEAMLAEVDGVELDPTQTYLAGKGSCAVCGEAWPRADHLNGGMG